jgi:hypothetical protein
LGPEVKNGDSPENGFEATKIRGGSRILVNE